MALSCATMGRAAQWIAVVNLQARALLPTRLAMKVEIIAAVDDRMNLSSNQLKTLSATGVRSPIDYERTLTATTQES